MKCQVFGRTARGAFPTIQESSLAFFFLSYAKDAPTDVGGSRLCKSGHRVKRALGRYAMVMVVLTELAMKHWSWAP